MRLVPVILVLLGIDYWSCSERLTGPADQAGLRLEIHLSSASGSPDHPLAVATMATNLRRASVYHSVPCAGTVIGIEVRGPDGRPVFLRDPRFVPACPDLCCAPLAPHSKLESDLAFDGALFTAAGERYVAPAGEYAILARFDATSEPNGGSALSVTRRAAFRWESK